MGKVNALFQDAQEKLEEKQMTLEQIRKEMETEAYIRALGYFDRELGGEDWGACGFAWVTIQPKHKGNTKLGKQERHEFGLLGASKDWTGKRWMIWNPARFPCQNVDTLGAGAAGAADVLKRYGYLATACTRLD